MRKISILFIVTLAVLICVLLMPFAKTKTDDGFEEYQDKGSITELEQIVVDDTNYFISDMDSFEVIKEYAKVHNITANIVECSFENTGDYGVPDEIKDFSHLGKYYQTRHGDKDVVLLIGEDNQVMEFEIVVY